jgi:hypothetical protein
VAGLALNKLAEVTHRYQGDKIERKVSLGLFMFVRALRLTVGAVKLTATNGLKTITRPKNNHYYPAISFNI